MRIVTCWKWVALGICMILVQPATAGFRHDGDVSVRIDDTSDRSSRRQYRLRYSPELQIDEKWSLQAFIASGDAYGSAYNTFDDNDDEIHLRRLFTRFADGDDKIEFGVIPPYKGRVSSVGLSKEGWIRGVRAVRGVAGGAVEVVLGNLSNLDASRAFTSSFDLSYIEVEYSARLDQSWSFELGAEEILDDRFVRGEMRFHTKRDWVLAAELIHNTDAGDSKVVLSAEREIASPVGALEWFTYYTHTGSDFGLRAELSEDFLDVGHALATKIESDIAAFPLAGWFAELEIYEDQSRIKAGIQLSLK